MSTLFSGGADGADLHFDQCAKKAGHQRDHFSFQNHKCLTENRIVLSQKELFEADDHLIIANKTIKRRFTKGFVSYTQNLLRRNWYQSLADSIYVISSLDNNNLVQGGSAWATQCFIDRHNGTSCEAYLFDQNINLWYKWNSKWVIVDVVPSANGIYAGIGRRNIVQSGYDAIERLYI